MTCMTMLEQMLEADRRELSGLGESPLAVHLHDCRHCQAVAAQLLSDTHALSTAIAGSLGRRAGGTMSGGMFGPARQRRSRSPFATRVVLGTLAAALAIVVVRTWPRAADTGPSAVAVAAPSLASLPAAVIATPQRSVIDAPRSSRVVTRAPSIQAPQSVAVTAQRVETQPITVEAETRVAPVTPVRLDLSPNAQLSSERVTVDPPAGRHATVMRTADPAVTVVWLY